MLIITPEGRHRVVGRFAPHAGRDLRQFLCFKGVADGGRDDVAGFGIKLRIVEYSDIVAVICEVRIAKIDSRWLSLEGKVNPAVGTQIKHGNPPVIAAAGFILAIAWLGRNWCAEFRVEDDLAAAVVKRQTVGVAHHAGTAVGGFLIVGDFQRILIDRILTGRIDIDRVVIRAQQERKLVTIRGHGSATDNALVVDRIGHTVAKARRVEIEVDANIDHIGAIKLGDDRRLIERTHADAVDWPAETTGVRAGPVAAEVLHIDIRGAVAGR